MYVDEASLGVKTGFIGNAAEIFTPPSIQATVNLTSVLHYDRLRHS